jgi:tagatose-6-phosphate ketose/aldose isomerase
MAKLGRDERELEALGALATAREIEQQPAMLRKTHEMLLTRQDALNNFLWPLLQRDAIRVVLAGAGTSSFIGECLAPYLASLLACRVDAVATTDLVSAPALYFEDNLPTLLVSFGRSGSSPESVAAVDLANRLVPRVFHLAITCNGEGLLARRLEAAPNAMTILLPEETNDRSFAMTSSFSCMTYAALAAFSGIEKMAPRIEPMAEAVQTVIAEKARLMRALAQAGYERAVYLGSQFFKGLAREAALKLLELTDGRIIPMHDSSLGFRHGPKVVINDRTLVVIFLSNAAYTRSYDTDLLQEIRRDGKAGKVVAITAREEGIPAGVERILVASMADAQDVDLLLPFIVAPQIFAFEASITFGLSPDNPNPSGIVNRVVQGVRIHALES